MEFYKRRDITSRGYALCKTCRVKGQKAYYWSHKQKCREGTQRCNDAMRLEVLQHYSGLTPECALCGEDDMLVLNLDHIDGGGEQHRQRIGKMGLPFYRWIRQEGYPFGYQVLCANCNTRKWKLEIRDRK